MTIRVSDLPDFDSLLTGSTAIAFALTVAFAFLAPRLRKAKPNAVTAGIVPLSPLETESLPVEHDDPDYQECVILSQHIADLMIADEWTEIAHEMADWEASLASTPGGVRFHEIALKTCLSGLEALLEDAPRNTLADLEDALTEVGHFMDTYRQTPDNHIFAVLAARAHIAVGKACAGDDWPESERKAAWRRMAQHFISAGEILENFDAQACMSPLLAEAMYLQAIGSPKAEEKLHPLFRQWIDLDPSNSGIYDTHIGTLVSLDLVSGDDVLMEADDAMHRTENSLGFGGYALFFMPLLSEYDSSRDLLDPELYAASLMDLASHSATQAEVNHSAAALLVEIDASDMAHSAAYRDTLLLLIRQHLQVIYPRLWPISVEEIQELVAEAALVAPEVSFEETTSFVTSRPQGLAA
jgi:hypothetical protein